MARYISDQNKVVLLHESGTYASTSGNGVWLGMVQSHDVGESQGIIETRYLGGSSRNFSSREQGPVDIQGTITLNPQDMRLFAWAIGSVADTSGANSSHAVAEVNNNVRQSAYTSGTLNPPISFTLEDSKQATGTGRNFVRTVNGCVINTARIVASQSEKVTVEAEYIGQNATYGSGTTTAVVALTTRPYMWNDVSITTNGSTLQTVKEITFEIAKNTQGPHYLNGSRHIAAPFEQNRDYNLDITLDADTESAKMLYDEFYQGGSAFNITLDLDADGKIGVTGSQHAIFRMSGCRITEMGTPSTTEGPTEQTITIKPQTVDATIYDRIVKYNPW